VSYLEANYSVTWTDITSDLATNAVPQAQPGDIIVYSWNGNATLNHMAFVVGIASGDYPEVAEWGQFNFVPDVWDYIVNPSSPYVERGWTWSAISGKWLQQEFPNTTASCCTLTVATSCRRSNHTVEGRARLQWTSSVPRMKLQHQSHVPVTR
jgi:hypothetical protein